MDLKGPSAPLLAKDFKEPMDGFFILSGTDPDPELDLHIVMTLLILFIPNAQAPSFSNSSLVLGLGLELGLGPHLLTGPMAGEMRTTVPAGTEDEANHRSQDRSLVYLSGSRMDPNAPRLLRVPLSFPSSSSEGSSWGLP